MSTEWPLDTTDDDNTPLPPPWDGVVDIGEKSVESALMSLQHRQLRLLLKICRKLFQEAEARNDEQTALRALHLACAALYNSSQLALADRLSAMMSQRKPKAANTELSVRIELHRSNRLNDRGEHAEAMVIRQSALETAMALGDDRLIYIALLSLANSANDAGESRLALALYRQQEQLQLDDTTLEPSARSQRADTMAAAHLELALARRSAGDGAAARSGLEEARELALLACTTARNDRRSVYSLDTLVQVLLQLGKVREARAQVRRLTAGLTAAPSVGSTLWCMLQLSSARIDALDGAVADQTLQTLKVVESLQGQGAGIDKYIGDLQQNLLAAHGECPYFCV